MTEETVVGSGREAEIVLLSESEVLRRYRQPRDHSLEARAMTHVRDQGYPAPRVVDAREGGLVLERLSGPTMLADLASHPWRIWKHAALLARLHDQLHAITAPDWLPRPFGPGTALLHRDLHPDNIMLTPAGPVVIDWSGACGGPAAVDLARSWLLMATSEVPGGRAQRIVANLGRTTFLNAFLRKQDRDAACAVLPAITAQRMEDRNITGNERELIRNFAPRRCAKSAPLQGGGIT